MLFQAGFFGVEAISRALGALAGPSLLKTWMFLLRSDMDVKGAKQHVSLLAHLTTEFVF
jgi:hypothetical protein